jgi:hypothetical protein
MCSFPFVFECDPFLVNKSLSKSTGSTDMFSYALPDFSSFLLNTFNDAMKKGNRN